MHPVLSQLLLSSPTVGSHSRSNSEDAVFDIDKVNPEHQELRDQIIDEIVNTLRNMGNVHSLRGEQDEAMRYYSEVTGLRAAKQQRKMQHL